MSEEGGFKKNIKKSIENVADTMLEGREKIRILDLSGEQVSEVLNMEDEGIEDFIAERGFDFNEHYIRVKTPKAESEAYMKSPSDLKKWLRRTNLN